MAKEIPLRQCENCGFMARQIELSSVAGGKADSTPGFIAEYYELNLEDRKSGALRKLMLVTDLGPQRTHPACFRHVFDADTELESRALEGIDENRAGRELLAEKRPCEQWYLYTPGMGPQQHLEELKMHQLEQDRRNFELRLFEMNQTLQDRAVRVERRITIVLGILALLEVAAASVAIAIALGWIGSEQQPVQTAPSAETTPSTSGTGVTPP